MTEPIKLPPLPEARIVSYQTDSTMRCMELRTHSDEDMRDYACTAIEADRQNSMVFECGKAAGRQEVKDEQQCPDFWAWIRRAYREPESSAYTVHNMEVAYQAGRASVEADRQATQSQHAHDIPAGSGDPVWQTAMAHRRLSQAGVPTSDSECFLSVWGRVVELLRMKGLRLEGGLGEPLRFVADRQAKGEPVAWRDMKTAPKDGTAVLVLIPDSDIPKAVRWRNDCWEMTWDGHQLSEYDQPRYWMPCPSDPDCAPQPQQQARQCECQRKTNAVIESEREL